MSCIEQILQFKVCQQESEISALISFYKSALRIQKENVQRVLVSDLPEVSKEFRIFIYFKIAQTRFTSIQSPFFTFE